MSTSQPTAFRPDFRDAGGDLPVHFNELPEEDRARLVRERTRLLHVTGPARWHDEVRLVGNANGLLVLRDAIDAALADGAARTTAMASDGEGFGVEVTLCAASWEHPDWQHQPLPYSDPLARGAPDPTHDVTMLRAALRQANAALFRRGVHPVPDPTRREGERG